MKYLLFVSFILFQFASSGQKSQSVAGKAYLFNINKDGSLQSIVNNQTGSTFSFFKEGFKGPFFYLKTNQKTVELAPNSKTGPDGVVKYDGLRLHTSYGSYKNYPMIKASVRNAHNIPYQINTLGLRLGIDTYMEHYPDWEEKMFPTLLRCEKTHFWGYFMSPKGKIVVIASPDAIASWSHEYTQSWGEEPDTYGGHRITSINLDLLNQLPLPARHPQNLWRLDGGEEKIFRIVFAEANNLSEVPGLVHEITQAPVISFERSFVQQGQAFTFSVMGKNNTKIVAPNGTEEFLGGGNQFKYTTGQEGTYTIVSKSANGKQSEAVFYVRKPYGWYMQAGMDAVKTYPPRAAPTHCESWYGFYTTYAGSKYFPENKAAHWADSVFWPIMTLVFDTTKAEPLIHKFRIQNVSTMIGLLVDKYQANGNVADLEMAIRFFKFLKAAQTPDGAYRAHKVHYTSVIYIAKSLMELLQELNGKPQYQNHYNEILASVKKAIDELTRNKTNIQTEGEMTFEDGMISCSALQMSLFALEFAEGKNKKDYAQAAQEVLNQHQCLEQLLIPDARMRSASLRFWEAQYDVVMTNNFFNSPHGWTAWTIYANYYLYLLTGEPQYLTRTFNGLNTCLQLINLNTKELSWAFMVNPFVHAKQIARNLEGADMLNVPGQHYNAANFANRTYIAGEEPVAMVSDWFFGNANDNDVHEIFKCLEEVALNKAYVVEMPNGELVAYNCDAAKTNGTIEVTPSEALVTKVHFNLQKSATVAVVFGGSKKQQKLKKGLNWVVK